MSEKPSFDEQKGLRKLIIRGGENFYLYVGQADMMISGPGEGLLKNQEMYSQLNAICRISSKAMKLGMTLTEIADQLDKSRVSDSRTWVADISTALRQCAG